MPVDQPGGLISVLLEKGNLDRHDAALSLAAYDQEEVERALERVTLDPSTDEMLADTCGQSLATIWCRTGRLNSEILKRLRGTALELAIGTIKNLKPEWETEVKRALEHDPLKAAEWEKH